jgi:tetratricopeptide (TPR) repeat protein
MDPLVIYAGGKEVPLSGDELFEQGVGALQAQEFPRCIQQLSEHLERFPEHPARLYARYNLALCVELSTRYQEASEELTRYIKEAREGGASRSDLLDGEVRLGFNLVHASKPERALKLYTRLLTEEPLIGFDRAECHLRRAMAHISLEHFAEADRDLSLAMSHINGSIGPNREGNEPLAEVHFQRGELYRKHMRHIKLKMPLERMKLLFADKVLFFRKSLYAYVDALNVHHVYWGVAAGHQLGLLHEQLYSDFMLAEAPEDFDEETLAYYFYELEKKLAPLLKESISIYEKTMTLSVTHGVSNDWVRATERQLKRLRDLEEGVQRRLTLDPLEAQKQRPPARELMGPPLPKSEPQEEVATTPTKEPI